MKHGSKRANSTPLSSAMSVPVSDPIGNDPIGARATLRGLLELRSALELDDDGGRRLPPLEASSPPADASGGWGEQPSSPCCLESERLLFSEVQVRVGGTDQMKGGRRGRLERGEERGRSNRCSFFSRRISQSLFSPKNLTEPLSTKKTFSQDLERRTSEAASRAEHPSAKRAVRLLARRDLLDLSLEGAADIFEESAKEKKGSGGAASTATAATAALYLRALRSRTSSLLDAWRSLLEDCETEAEAELAAAEERARAAEARAEAAEAALREQLTTPTTTAAPRPRPPPSSFAAAALPPPLPDAIAAITLVSSPTKLKNLEVGKPEAHAAAAVKRKGPLRLPPTEAEARALLEAERAAEGGEGEAFRMPPASEVETPLSAVVATAAAAAATAARKGGSSLRGAPLPPQPPPLQRSSSSAASLLLLGLPGGGASSPATPGSPSLSLTALGKLAFFFLPRFSPPLLFGRGRERKIGRKGKTHSFSLSSRI